MLAEVEHKDFALQFRPPAVSAGRHQQTTMPTELPPKPLPPKLEFDWFSPEFHNLSGKYRKQHDFQYGTAGFRNKYALGGLHTLRSYLDT